PGRGLDQLVSAAGRPRGSGPATGPRSPRRRPGRARAGPARSPGGGPLVDRPAPPASTQPSRRPHPAGGQGGGRSPTTVVALSSRPAAPNRSAVVVEDGLA